MRKLVLGDRVLVTVTGKRVELGENYFNLFVKINLYSEKRRQEISILLPSRLNFTPESSAHSLRCRGDEGQGTVVSS